MIIRCPFCTRSHSIAEITKEQIQSEADNPTGVLVSDFPTPSADEEVETPRTDAGQFEAHDSRPDRMVVDAFLSRTIERELIQLRQQHNAEREKFNQLANSEIKALEIKYAEASRRADELNDLQARFYAEGIQLRASLAEKERENTQLKRENENTWRAHGQIVSQLSALQSELATAQKERFTPSKLNTKYLQQIESLKSQLQSAMEERDAEGKHRMEDQQMILKVSEDRRLLMVKLAEANSRLEEAEKVLRLCNDALVYGGIGDDRPHNRLIALIEAERSKYTGDNWNYWNYLSDKLQACGEPLSALLSRLSTSRSTENKTDEH